MIFIIILWGIIRSSTIQLTFEARVSQSKGRKPAPPSRSLVLGRLIISLLGLLRHNLGAAVDDVRPAGLEPRVADDGRLADGVLGHDVVLALAAANLGDEEVGEAREHEEADDEDHDNVHEGEAVDVGRVLEVAGLLVHELGVDEGEDEADGGRGDVLEGDGPEPVDPPVVAADDRSVEVALELVALESRRLEDGYIKGRLERCWVWTTYRVEGVVPKAAKKGVLAPEGRSLDGGNLANEGRGNGRDDEDAESNTSTGRGVDEVSDEQASNVGSNVAAVVEEVADQADLVDGVPPAVEGGGEEGLAPDGEEEGEIVDEHVDGIEQVETNVGAVEEADEVATDGGGGSNDPAGDTLTPVSVADHSDQHLEEGEDTGQTKNDEGEEEDSGEEVGARHLGKRTRVVEEARAEGGQATGDLEAEAKVSDDTHDSKGGDDLNGGVGEGDDEGVLDGVGVLGGVRGVRGEVAETDTDGEEHLTEGILPDARTLERLGAPHAEVELETVGGVGERQGADSEDKDHDEGQGHGDVDDTAGEADTLEHAAPGDTPDHQTPEGSLANQLHGAVRLHGPVVTLGEDGLDDLVEEEVGGVLVLPREGADERLAEVVQGVRQDGNVVAADGEAIEDGREAETLGTVVVGVPGADAASAIGLAEADLEEQDGDADEEEAAEVGDEELQAVVVVHDGRESEQVTETDSTAHGAQNELGAGVEVVTAILVLFGVGRHLEPELPDEALRRGVFGHGSGGP